MVLNVYRNHKAYSGREEGREGGMEVVEGWGGGGRLYTYCSIVTTRMTYALRWACSDEPQLL